MHREGKNKMAIISNDELAKIRREVSRDDGAVNYIKPRINAAIQAMEDWYNDEKLTVSGLVDTATFPFVFTNAQKKKIGAYWLQHKFLKEKA